MEIKEMTAKDKKRATGKHLWQVLRAIYYMLHDSISKHTTHFIAGDLHLRRLFDSLSCRSVDPSRAYYSPREVEFSCSNTPCHAYNRRRGRKRGGLDIARAFEILNSEPVMMVGEDSGGFESATPSPAAVWRFVKSPAVVRQLRVTGSPFPKREEEEEEGREIDREAEEFIERFYEQLRLQRIG